MALDYGTGGGYTVSLAGPFTGGDPAAVKLTEITLLADSWKGGESPYYQVVEVDGVSINSMVDLQPSVAQLKIFHDMDLAFTTENNEGVVTVYAIGDKPGSDYTIQATITKVDGAVIKGNTVGTTMPRSNWNQTDSSKADYIKGKEAVDQAIQNAQNAANGAATTASNAQTAANNAANAASNAQSTANEAKNLANEVKNTVGSANYLPSCTAADNGKFLRVVNGVATWQTVPNAEEVAV